MIAALDAGLFSDEHGAVSRREQEAKRLFGELGTVMNAITRGVEAELKPFGLTHAQFLVLLTVQASPDVSQRELSDRLGVTTGNVSMLVSKLEAAGLVERIPAGAAFHLRVTVAGRATLESLSPVRERFVRDLFAHLSVEDLTRTADVLHTVRPH